MKITWGKETSENQHSFLSLKERRESKRERGEERQRKEAGRKRGREQEREWRKEVIEKSSLDCLLKLNQGLP